MTENELRAAIRGGVKGGYFFWGDEDYLKRYWIGALRSAVLADCPPGLECFNDVTLTLEDGDLTPLADAIRSLPVMAPRKFIHLAPTTLDGWKKETREPFLAALGDFAAAGGEDTVLVLSVPRGGLDVGAPPKRPSAFFRALCERLTPVEFPLQSGARLRRWVERHFADAALAVQPETTDALLARCAPDMDSLSGEIDKLIAYAKAHERETVTPADVVLVTCPGARDDAFALANAVLAGDRRGALAALDACRRRREDPAAVAAALARVMSDLLTVAAMAEAGTTRDEVASVLKMHEYKATLYLRAASEFGTPRLLAALRRVLEADRLTKSAALGYIPLERFVCTIPLGAAFRRRTEAPS